jgi:two-component system, LuxR family, response regulator FixJ
MSGIRCRPFSGRAHLTRREIDVLEQITAGVTNKVAARNLGISSRTIEVHRRNILKKLDAKNAVHLLRIVMEQRVGPLEAPEDTDFAQKCSPAK